MIQKYLEDYAAFWENSKSDLPFITKKFNQNEKQSREEILDQYIQSVKVVRNGKLTRKNFNEKDEQLFFENTRTFFRDGLDFTQMQLQVMFSDELTEVTRQFVRKARRFDPTLTFHDIFQACRNMWIMNGLQIVLGLPIRQTSSMFAYSLLYPYTDNLIDNPAISSSDKLIFSNNFYLRLNGQNPEPNNDSERTIFSLVSMIEDEYPRSDYPEVYQSLLAIHQAQTQSMYLIHSGDALSETEILKICIAKGGASVLADGYLVAGRLSNDQEYFLFGYGAYLQLLDDIQDVDEDHAAGLKTVFSGINQLLDTRINKTYWFGEQVMKSLPLFGGQHIDVFQSLMRKSMDLFIIEAIAQNSDYYSKKYVLEMENHSPFSFSFIQKRKEKFAPYNGLLLTAIEEFALNEYTNAN
ncbi:MAG: class 1 isoprenoid biosynthesis enzyme [Prolixibacteraceae bacterium]|nr:class 1 isoprenoid biosynthesis enzyme [Prolixibacteraceae bacterium]